MPLNESGVDAEIVEAFSAPAEVVSAPVQADISLDEWCADRSRRLGRRIEALTAFMRRCQRAGLTWAPADRFESEFRAFLSTPA